MSKQTMWILVIVAFLVGLYCGYAYEKQKFVGLITSQRIDMQRQIDNAKTMNKQVVPLSPTSKLMK